MGLWKSIKKAAKSVGKFVKKNWKTIVGVATAGQIRVAGAPGGWGMMQNARGGRSGEGAPSRFGGGGAAILLYAPGGSTWGAGVNAPSYGAGGSGGVYYLASGDSPGLNASGGAGGSGLVVVYEYT